MGYFYDVGCVSCNERKIRQGKYNSQILFYDTQMLRIRECPASRLLGCLEAGGGQGNQAYSKQLINDQLPLHLPPTCLLIAQMCRCSLQYQTSPDCSQPSLDPLSLITGSPKARTTHRAVTFETVFDCCASSSCRLSSMRAVAMVTFVYYSIPRCITGPGLVKYLIYMYACVLIHLSHVRIFTTLWTVAHQAPLSMGFPR